MKRTAVARVTKQETLTPIKSADSAQALPAAVEANERGLPDKRIPETNDHKYGSGDANGLAGKLQKELIVASAEVWTAGGKALIDALKNGSGAAVDTQDNGHTRAQLRKNAAAEVARLWKAGPDNEVLLKALFPAAREHAKSRRVSFKALLSYAKQVTRKPDRLLWNSKSADPLAASIRHAWEPLGIWDEAEIDKAVVEARELFENPDGKLQTSRVALNPLIARWLTVMRAKQLFDSKKRTGA